MHRFPCDTIKVDRSLVRGSGLDGSSPLILRSVVALAHELGKEVVAEGVETQADAAYLRSIGCEYGQGFITASRCRPRTWPICLPPSPAIASVAIASAPARRRNSNHREWKSRSRSAARRAARLMPQRSALSTRLAAPQRASVPSIDLTKRGRNR